MSPFLISVLIVTYFLILLLIAWITGRNASNHTFFAGDKRSPWFIVAYGMIGASLSGVTFLSVPGMVGKTHFTYFMIALGYFFGYLVIIKVLLPLYYKLNLTSIYTYLEQRFGYYSYKTGSVFFIISRVLGAGVRMYLVVLVLQQFVFNEWNVNFIFSTAIFILLILALTYHGGIKTIVYTDTLQTTFMLLALVLTIVFISRELNLGVFDLAQKAKSLGYTEVMDVNWKSPTFFLKNFFSGMFITIVMTGLDQEMMQKNLSCRSLKDAQKNMTTFSIIIVFVNLIFLFLGAFIYIFFKTKGIAMPERTDELYPVLAINYLGPVAAALFVIGLISAAFPSADGALTSLTTSCSIDLLNIQKRHDWNADKKIRIRKLVHISFAILFLIVIVILNAVNDRSVIDILFTIAGYTYGPLLGLYAFGLYTKRSVNDKWVPLLAVLSPVLCYVISATSKYWLGGYQFGFELLILNGLLMFAGLWLMGTGSEKLKK